MANSEEVKKAYAEIILNTTKEAAARILAAERRAAAVAGGLAAAKEDAVAALLRLKSIMESKIKEVELQSLGHVKKIQELEVQLSEAQTTINSLQTELQRVSTELKEANKNVAAQENRNSHATSGKNECSENCSSDFKVCVPRGPEYPSALEINSTMNQRTADDTYGVGRDLKKNGSLEDSENPQACNPDLASFMIRRKEPELYRNGCTQRIRALEQHSLTANPSRRQSDEQSGELKSHLIIGKNETAKNPCSTQRSIMEEVLQTKNLSKCKRRRGRRSRPIFKPGTCTEQGKPECRSSDNLERNGCLLLIQALEQNLSPTTLRKGDNQFTILKDDSRIGRNEGATDPSTADSIEREVPQAKNLQSRTRGGRRLFKISEPGAYDLKRVPDSSRTLSRVNNENNMSNNSLSSRSIEDHPSLLQCTMGTRPSDTKQSQIDSEYGTRVGHGAIMNEIEDEGNLLMEETERKTPKDDIKTKKVVENNEEMFNLDSDKIDAPIVNSLTKEDNINIMEPCGTSVQAEGARYIKYTFNRRKRKSGCLDSNTESAVPEKSSSFPRPSDNQETEAEPQKDILLTESPRSNRRLVQVARQLISLSGKKW